MAHGDIDGVGALLARLNEDLVELLADDAFVGSVAEHAAPFIEPDAAVVLHAAEGVTLGGSYRGLDGLIAAWREWLSPFASYRFTVESIFRDGDRVVVLVQQTGRTVHGGVDVPSSPSAAVFTMREGRVARMAFYLDRAEAARAEGFALP